MLIALAPNGSATRGDPSTRGASPAMTPPLVDQRVPTVPRQYLTQSDFSSLRDRALNGQAEAAAEIGRMYARGEPAMGNVDETFRWLTRAIDLGSFYWAGNSGLRQDRAEAVKHWHARNWTMLTKPRPRPARQGGGQRRARGGRPSFCLVAGSDQGPPSHAPAAGHRHSQSLWKSSPAGNASRTRRPLRTAGFRRRHVHARRPHF